MRGGRNLDVGDSPPRAWSARWQEGECERWSTAIDTLIRFARIGQRGRGQSNLECTADTEDTVIGRLRRKALDGLLDILALLGDQIVESSWAVSKCFRRTLLRTISEEPGLRTNSTRLRSHSKDMPPVRDELNQPFPNPCFDRSWSRGCRCGKAGFT